MLARPQAAASVTQPQRRGLASAGKGKGGKDGGGGGGEEEGMFGRLKKTFEEEIEKVRASQQAHGRLQSLLHSRLKALHWKWAQQRSLLD